MASDAITAIRDDILALLRQQKEILERVESASEVLKDSRLDGQVRVFDVETARQCRQVLDNEFTKVTRLEMVLAVVGTMKAGKSTTINAIVGTEVLPNRNQPMTTLPTLVRHTAGQTVPVLRFPKPGPLLSMAARVRESLSGLRISGRLDQLGLYQEPDGRLLVEGLLSVEPALLIRERCRGQDEIFTFLKTLNDLMRLAREPLIGIEPPFEEYDDVDELPVIEVEFFHLRQTEVLRQGQLSLLDTPGPNEAGQSDKLRKILKSQLSRASAVLAVLDYTQLKSEAEAEIRAELAEVVDQAEDRLFVLVNKFDQQDRNSMDNGQTRHHVALGLMGGRVDPRRVFPVSSRNGYLANRARQEIEIAGRLPDARVHAWVADFARLGLGISWQRTLDSPRLVIAAAEDLWQTSQFDAPIQEVVVKAASQAAMISIKSALAKMLDYDNQLSNFLVLRRGSLGDDGEKLQALISGLKQDMIRIDEVQMSARIEVFHITALYGSVLDGVQKAARDALLDAISQYFQSGGVVEPGRLHAATGARLSAIRNDSAAHSSGVADTFAKVFGPPAATELRGPPGTGPSFDPDLPAIACDSEAAARKLAARIMQPLQVMAQEVIRFTESRFALAADTLERSVTVALARSVGGLLDKANERLQGGGFRLEVRFPEAQIKGIGLTLDRFTAVSISQRVHYHKSLHETEGMLGAIGRWWRGTQSEWGYEVRTVQEVRHLVNLSRMAEKVTESVTAGQGAIGERANAYVSSVLEPVILNHFKELKTYLDGFRGILRDGVEDHQRRHQSLAELRRAIDALAKDTAEHFKLVRTRKLTVDALPPAAFEQPLGSLLATRDEGGDGRHPAAAGPEPRPGAAGRAKAVPMETGGEDTSDGESTQMDSGAGRRTRFELSYGDRTVTISVDGGRLTIGRDTDNTVVVSGHRASRRHAEVVCLKGVYTLIDSSSNGTVVAPDQGKPIRVSHGSQELKGSGQIGLGLEPGDPRHTVSYRCVSGDGVTS
jgi:GTPase SAR1 family protein